MVSPPTRHTPLSWQRAYQAGDATIRAFYAGNGPDHLAQALRPTGGNPLRAADLAEWRAWLLAAGAAAELVDPLLIKLSQPDALAVVTGQQAGAALGPLYTFHKAAGAIRHARAVETKSNRPTVAVFWIASDDHDLAEVRDVTWLSREGALLRQPLAAADRASVRPVFTEPLDPALVGEFLGKLADTTTPSEFRPEVLELLASAMADASFEDQFLRLAIRWLLPLGILPIVPRLRFLRNRATELFAREIDHAGESSRSVIASGEALSAAGVEPPLHRRGNELNFFLLRDGLRCRVVQAAGGFEILPPGDRNERLAHLTADELHALLRSHQEDFSPNAILRPLVQDHALPSVGYVGGPAEVLYHAQLGRLYSDFGVFRPVVLPRPNVILVDGKSEKAMAKLGIDAASLAAGTDPTLALEGAVQGPEAEAMRGHHEALTAAIASLRNWAGDFPDPAIGRSLDKMESAVTLGWEKLAERITHHLATRDEDRQRQLVRLRENLFPGGEPQERQISLLAPLLINYGPAILPMLLEDIDPEAAHFQVIVLSGLRDDSPMASGRP